MSQSIRDKVHLVVEWEPGDVDLAGGLEDARWDVGAHALACNNHIRVIRSIESLVSTGKSELSSVFQLVKLQMLLNHRPVIHE